MFQILTIFQLGMGFPGMFRYVSSQLTMSAGRTPARVSSTSKHGLSTKHREAILPHPVRCGNLRCFSSMFQIRCREIYGPNGRCYTMPSPTTSLASFGGVSPCITTERTCHWCFCPSSLVFTEVKAGFESFDPSSQKVLEDLYQASLAGVGCEPSEELGLPESTGNTPLE